MKVRGARPVVRALVGAGLVAALSAAALFSAPAPAEALTREQIIARARVWIAKRVPYSQSRYYRGYRQDCSGFVSMAWGLRTSYSTRTISKRARRIKITSLRPGDAVLVPGHVSVFGGWKNKKKRTYYALEQTTWGSHAKLRVRKVPRYAKALRVKTLTVPRRRVIVAASPARPATETAAVATSSTISAASVHEDDTRTTASAVMR